MLFAGICFEKLYNFWDRIGDFLNLCYQLNIPQKKIFLEKVMKQLSKIKGTSNNYVRLKEIYEKEYKDYLNVNRIKIVHYHQLDTYYWFEWVQHYDNFEYMKKLQFEKDQLPEKLNYQLSKTVKAFEFAVRLVSEYDQTF